MERQTTLIIACKLKRNIMQKVLSRSLAPSNRASRKILAKIADVREIDNAMVMNNGIEVGVGKF
jgi:hypothetical protein